MFLSLLFLLTICSQSSCQNDYSTVKFRSWHSSPTISLFLILPTTLKIKAEVFNWLIRLLSPWPPACYSPSFSFCFSWRSLLAFPPTYQGDSSFDSACSCHLECFPHIATWLLHHLQKFAEKSSFQWGLPWPLVFLKLLPLYYSICVFLLQYEFPRSRDFLRVLFTDIPQALHTVPGT